MALSAPRRALPSRRKTVVIDQHAKAATETLSIS
jgi:hypothetical protein